MTKAKKVWLAAGILVGGTIFIAAAYVWVNYRFDRVALGIASAKFPWGDFSVEELELIYPQHDGAVNVATKQTPEETHRKFVEALKAGDLDGAVECCFLPKDWEGMKEGLENVTKDGQLPLMIKDLDTELRKSFSGDTTATYDYSFVRDGVNYGSSIEFVKNYQGVWLIKAL